MNREMFSRMADLVLRKHNVPNSQVIVNDLTTQMDMFAAVMGEAPPPAADPAPAPEPPPARAPFPELPIEAVMPAPPIEPQPSLITLDTRMPSQEERVRPQAAPQAPIRSLREQGGKMGVQHLSKLIQERTPPALTLDVPLGDGRFQQVIYQRNVIPMNAHDSVQLVYAPPNVLPSAREATEVIEVINIDDQIDIARIIEKLRAQAVETLRPKGMPREVPVRPFSGPVNSSGAYSDGNSASAGMGDSGAAGNILATSADTSPAGYVAAKMPSAYHPGQTIPQ